MCFSLSRGLAPSGPLSFCQSFHCFFLRTAESDVFSKVRVCEAMKAPVGLLLLRKRELAYGRRNRLITPPVKRNRAFPTRNALLYISLLSVAFGRVRPIRGRTLFFYYASSFSTRSIRYPTPTWVWIRCGASGHRSNFLRRDAM